jgi:hypothetical protein
MKKTIIVTTLSSVLVTTSAVAGPPFLAQLERLHRNCSIPKEFVKTATGKIDGKSISLALYTVEGCGGGNNWHPAVTAFDAEGASLGTYELPEGTAASFPENGAVRKGKIAIKTLSLGPQDAHCCPTVKGITYLTLKGHKLVSLAR